MLRNLVTSNRWSRRRSVHFLHRRSSSNVLFIYQFRMWSLSRSPCVHPPGSINAMVPMRHMTCRFTRTMVCITLSLVSARLLTSWHFHRSRWLLRRHRQSLSRRDPRIVWLRMPWVTPLWIKVRKAYTAPSRSYSIWRPYVLLFL
jgi:hypothetical protein